MLTPMFPDDAPVAHREDRRQGPRVAHFAMDAMPLANGAQPAPPCIGTEHGPHSTALHVERSVQVAARVGQGYGPGKQPVEERGPLFRCALIHEHHRRVLGVMTYGVGELVDELTVEQSTVMTQEHQQGGAPLDHVSKGAGLGVIPGHPMIQLRRAQWGTHGGQS